MRVLQKRLLMVYKDPPEKLLEAGLGLPQSCLDLQVLANCR